MIRNLKNYLGVLKRFFEPVVSNERVAFRAFLSTLMRGLFGIFNVYMIKVLVKDIELGNTGLLLNHIGIYVGVIIIYQITNFLVIRKGYIHHAASKVLNDTYLRKYVLLDNNATERYGTGRLISIIEGGISVWKSLLGQLFLSFPEFIAAFVYACFVIGSLGIRYLVSFFVLLFGVQALSLYLNSYSHSIRKLRYELETVYKRSYIRILMSKFEILQTGSIEKEIKIVNNNIDQQRTLDFKKHPYEHWAFNIADQTILFSKLFVYFYIGIQVIEGNESIENLFLYIGLLTYVDATMRNLIGVVVKNIIKKYSAIQRLWELFDNTPTITGYDTGSVFNYQNGSIAIKNLTYGYAAETPIFKNFSLNIQGGKKTALVGVSGSGKSTLVKLIAGYLRPDEGSVAVDGQNLKEVSLKSYYPHIGYLTQEPSVFDGTIRENLLYAVNKSPLEKNSIVIPENGGMKSCLESTSTLGNNAAMDSCLRRNDTIEYRVEEAIRLSKCEFIYDLPKGIDTEIGERGVRLSGGQRQRLAIAKIFLKNPEIIILDEPTSALDSFSEEAITQAMHTLFENRTVIIIAHRLQTVKEADEIILLEQGKIQERGTHEQLVHIGGQYARMLEVQTGF